VYIYVWLGFYGGLLGAVAAVLIADYWLVRRTDLRLADLYRPHGAYWYAGGWNWRAVAALAVGALLAVGGAWSAPGQGPFPQDGLIPALKPLYDYNWMVGFAAALLVYLGLTAVSGVRRHTPAGQPI
jgi:nucleobase:cation symporter-1, NCS1 family